MIDSIKFSYISTKPNNTFRFSSYVYKTINITYD